MRHPPRTTPRAARRSGFVLIVALVLVFAIASTVVTLGRMARTEALASANQLAACQAGAVERGAEQYVTAIASDLSQLDTLDEEDFEAVPVGTGYFWIVRPDYLDDDLPRFGLVDEAAKMDLNSITAEQLMKLNTPDITQETADAIEQWHQQDTGLYSGSGYSAKAAAYDVPEELMLVEGVTRELYDGEANQSATGGTGSTSLTGDDAMRHAGWRNFFTTFATPSTNPDTNQPGAPMINVNQAPRDVLLCLMGNNVTAGQIDTALQQRATAVNSNPTDTTWFTDAFQNFGTAAFRARVTGRGTRYFSADIVAVAGNGRAFKRVRIVVDAADPTTAAPRIVYRRDVTGEGFPLDASILTDLRAGKQPSTDSSPSRTGSSAR